LSYDDHTLVVGCRSNGGLQEVHQLDQNVLLRAGIGSRTEHAFKKMCGELETIGNSSFTPCFKKSEVTIAGRRGVEYKICNQLFGNGEAPKYIQRELTKVACVSLSTYQTQHREGPFTSYEYKSTVEVSETPLLIPLVALAAAVGFGFYLGQLSGAKT
jgi:hypothetical protein